MTADLQAVQNEVAALTLRVARPLIWHDRTFCQLRNSPAFDLPAAIIARDAVRDIATFAVSQAVPSQIDAIPLDCRGSWPPPEPQNL